MKNQRIKQSFLLIFLALLSASFSCNFSFASHQFSFAIAQAQNKTKAEADRLKQEGEKLYAQGQFVQATETLERAMNIYKEIGDTENYKEVLNSVVAIYYFTGGGKDKIEALIAERDRLEDGGEIAVSSGSQETETYIQEESQDSTELNSEVDNLISSGILAVQKEDFGEGRKYFQQALSKAQGINRELEKIVTQTEIGKSYLYEGDYDKAIATFQLVEDLSNKRYSYIEEESEINNSIQSESSNNLDGEITKYHLPFLQLFGEAYLQNNQPDDAIVYFEKIPTILTQLENQLYQDLSPEEYQQAKGTFGESIFNIPIIVTDPNLNLSRANYSLGNYQKALEYAEKAISKAEATRNQTPQWYSRSNLGVRTGGAGDGYGYALAGIALEKLGELDRAEVSIRKAVQIFEYTSNKSTFKGDVNHSLKLFNNQVRAASWLQRILIAQNKPEEALAATEWGRGQLLVEAANATNLSEASLEEKVDALIDAEYGLSDLCQERERFTPKTNPIPQVDIPEVQFQGDEFNPPTSKINKQFNNQNIPSTDNPASQKLAQCDNAAEIEKIRQATLEDARENPEEFEKTFKEYTSVNNSVGIKSNSEPPSIEQLKQIARSQQATIVEYSFISDSTYFHGSRQNDSSRNVFPGKKQTLLIWVIKPTGEIQYRQIDLKAKNVNIEELVVNTRRGTHTRVRAGVEVQQNGESINGFSRQIAEEQLKQLHQLLIEPINDLLPSDPEAKIIFVPHQELFLIPFTALIDNTGKYLIEKHTVVTAPSILALELTSQKKQLTHENQSAIVVGDPTIPPIPDNQPSIQLYSLEYAEQEGNEVARILNTQSLTGNQAKESKVLESLPNAQYIHLATHGLLDDYTGFGIPGTIVLASSDLDDGFLSASVIQEMDLSAELAVLSACDTGIGDITGDGVVGLSRAFIIAGVPSVVVSLWKVDDAATGQLMIEFYRNFRELNIDKAHALRNAMLEVMKTNPDPYYWAAFTLVGESE